MFLYIVVGMTRQGKSRYVKAMIKHPEAAKKPCFVFDYQNEYGDTYFTDINNKIVEVPGVGLQPYRPGLLRSRFRGSFEEFAAIACEKTKDENGEDVRVKRGYLHVFDESTIFLKGGTPKNIRDLVVSRFHDRNNLVFVFHKLKTVPPDLMDLANYVVIFKTMDTEQAVEQRFDNEIITEAFRRQKKKPDKSPATIVNLRNNTIDGKNFSI